MPRSKKILVKPINKTAIATIPKSDFSKNLVSIDTCNNDTTLLTTVDTVVHAAPVTAVLNIPILDNFAEKVIRPCYCELGTLTL